LDEDEFDLEGNTETEPPADHAAFIEFADIHDAQNIVDQAVADIIPQAVKANAGIATQIEKIVRAAESFEDMQIMLAELLSQDADEDELAELVSRIMLNTQAFGSMAVQEEANG